MDGNCINNGSCGCNEQCILIFSLYSPLLLTRNIQWEKNHFSTTIQISIFQWIIAIDYMKENRQYRIYKYNKCHHHAKWFLPYSCSRNVTSVHKQTAKKNCIFVRILKKWKIERTQWYWHTNTQSHFLFTMVVKQ